jgi:LysM repeat protein
MTERGQASVDGSACPFVAFEVDRDERATSPDHRHRCYAESPPAPRAAAHQEAYCLSSAFPVCPVFQDWARRESARARPSDEVAAPAPLPVDEPSPDDVEQELAPDPGPPVESAPKRNPPRDWAAPPPWATGGAAGNPAPPAGSTPEVVVRRTDASAGLAGSAADRLASGEHVTLSPASPAGDASPPRPSSPSTGRSAGPDAELAGLVGGAAAASSYAPEAYARPPTRGGRRPTVSSTRTGSADREKDRENERARSTVSPHDGPSWERARRYEAYPTIKARPGVPSLPNLPRVVLVAGALGIAALALFFLPALLGVGGGDDGASPTPSASVAPSFTPEPTPEPVPTPQVYVIEKGDTLSKIAKRFDVTLEALLAANKDTISNPDRIKVGDEIIIPVPEPPEEVGDPSAEPSAEEG